MRKSLYLWCRDPARIGVFLTVVLISRKLASQSKATLMMLIGGTDKDCENVHVRSFEQIFKVFLVGYLVVEEVCPGEMKGLVVTPTSFIWSS